MQAHTEHESGICWLVAVGLGHGLLELDGGTQRINGAGELDQSTIAGQLDQAPSVFRQNRIEVFRAVLSQARQRPALVAPHQAGVADNVRSNDCRQFALLTRHGNFPRHLQRIVESIGRLDNREVKSGQYRGRTSEGSEAGLPPKTLVSALGPNFLTNCSTCPMSGIDLEAAVDDHPLLGFGSSYS